MEITTEQRQAAFDIVVAITNTIRELSANSPLGGVPNGELWARIDGTLSFSDYTAVIAMLKRTKLVEERSHLLVWVGPKL